MPGDRQAIARGAQVYQGGRKPLRVLHRVARLDEEELCTSDRHFGTSRPQRAGEEAEQIRGTALINHTHVHWGRRMEGGLINNCLFISYTEFKIPSFSLSDTYSTKNFFFFNVIQIWQDCLWCMCQCVKFTFTFEEL